MAEHAKPAEMLLAQLAQQIQDGYDRFPANLHGGRLVFGIDEDWWTLIFERDGPRMYRGAIAPEDPENDPFLVMRGTAKQLSGYLLGRLDLEDETNRDFGFEGNSEALHAAVGQCL